jgi:hypothetical protein
LSITADEDGWLVEVSAERPIQQAGLVLQLPGLDRAPSCAADGATVAEVTRHGRTFYELAVDLPAGVSTWRLTR